MESLGTVLKTERERKGIRLEEIASITKIHVKTLEGLEREAWSELPPDPFLRGFIIAYAKYIGLNTQDVLGKYYAQTRQSAATPSVETNTGESVIAPNASEQVQVDASQPNEDVASLIENSKPTWHWRVTGMAALAALVVAGGILTYLGKKAVESSHQEARDLASGPSAAPLTPVGEAVKDTLSSLANQKAPVVAKAPEAVVPTPTPAAPVLPAAPAKKVEVAPLPAPTPPTVKEAPAEPAKVAAEPATVTPPTGPVPHSVVVEGNDRTWLKVVIDDEKPKEIFLPKGEKATYEAHNKIKVVLGNASGAKVYHNGDLSEGEKFQGTIYSYIFPKNARFPQDAAARKIANTPNPNEKGKSESGNAADTKAVAPNKDTQ